MRDAGACRLGREHGVEGLAAQDLAAQERRAEAGEVAGRRERGRRRPSGSWCPPRGPSAGGRTSRARRRACGRAGSAAGSSTIVELMPVGAAIDSASRSPNGLARGRLEGGREKEVSRARLGVRDARRPDEQLRGQAAHRVAGGGAGRRRVFLVLEVAGAGDVGGERTDRHGEAAVLHARHVALDRSVEVDAALVGQARHHRGGQRHGDLVDAELGRARDGPVAVHVGEAEGRRPDDLVADRDGDGGARVELEDLVEHGPRSIDRAGVRGLAGFAADGRRDERRGAGESDEAGARAHAGVAILATATRSGAACARAAAGAATSGMLIATSQPSPGAPRNANSWSSP